MALLAAATAADGQAPPALPPGLTISDTYNCPDPPVVSKEPVCCVVTTTVEATGKASSAKAKCTHPAYEAISVRCELERQHEPRLRAGGKKEGFTHTFTRTHLPSMPNPFTAENLIAMMKEADKRCDILKATS